MLTILEHGEKNRMPRRVTEAAWRRTDNEYDTIMHAVMAWQALERIEKKDTPCAAKRGSVRNRYGRAPGQPSLASQQPEGDRPPRTSRRCKETGLCTKKTSRHTHTLTERDAEGHSKLIERSSHSGAGFQSKLPKNNLRREEKTLLAHDLSRAVNSLLTTRTS